MHKGQTPSPQEIDALVTLFSERRYTEAATLARTMTVRFPLHGFGWKVLGAALKSMGQSADALASMQKAATLSPNEADAHSNLGVTLQDMGRLDEAEASFRRALQLKPDYAEAHSNLGNILQGSGRLPEAEASYRRALQLKPDYADAHNNLGNTLQSLGRLTEAEASYRRALELKPDYAEAHNNLGVTLKDMGRLDEAEASLRRALQLKPDYAEAHNNLANILQGSGRLPEAEASYRRALQLKADYAGAHSNLGVILHDLGSLDEAEASYRRALQVNPDFSEALNNLVLLCNEQGKPAMALNLIKQSLQIKETEEAKSIFVRCIKRLRFTQDDSEVRVAMIRALTEHWGRPSDLALIGIDLVKLNPDIGECAARAANAWPVRLPAHDLFGPNGLAAVAVDPLLCALLDSVPICDIEMERFLTMARRTLLETATGMTALDDEAGASISFYSALARQCFINEYVFCSTADEIQKASDLRDALVAALEAETRVPTIWPVAVAAYFPLCSLPLAARLLEGQWPETVTAVLKQQVREPAEELQLRTAIPRLTNIEDEVSLLVQGQYEENPYPRWVNVAPVVKVKNIAGYLRQKFPLVPFKRHDTGCSIEMLIAGCGTGQHSIETAQQFHGAKVLAVDLSISSLCYAKRKTRELGLASIEYAQADIMKLGLLGSRFDVIESVGVLHHLADPLAGWRVLLPLLRPGGFMRLGLYSEVARRNIVKARAFIAGHGYGSSANDIRQCRQDLVDLDKSAGFGTTIKSSDFFSISACRDLLFHVQEHRMTLTAIDEFLRENNLAFLGFEIDPLVLRAYKRRFPGDRAATNLVQWQTFENGNYQTKEAERNLWGENN